MTQNLLTATSASTAARRARATSYARTRVPATSARHLGNRFSYAMTPALDKQMRRAGGPQAWFEQQLRPDGIDDGYADGFSSWWTAIEASPGTLWSRHQSEVEPGWEATANYARWCLLRRIHSERQLHEVMTEFWENHLHVALSGDSVFTHRAAYGRTIRSHALGRFDDMLYDAVTHPAMGLFLDNAVSTAKAPNENLGRELLELHTVGTGHYTESDVKNSARILTGYRVDRFNTWRAFYDEPSHATGAVQVLGFRHDNADADGRAVTRDYLRYLAHHPLTAQRIARKLAVRFISDDPEPTVVEHLADVFVRSGTDIPAVLRALVATSAFQRSVGAKVRTPTDDLVATHRVLRTRFARPEVDDSAANAILWQSARIGQIPFAWGRPDGQPEDNASWSSASRLLASFDVHWTAAGGWWPRREIRYRKPSAWLPEKSLRFDELVDHLSRRLLARPSSDRLLKACCQATETGAREKVNRAHPIVRWKMPTLLSTLLDTPDHMTR